MFPASIAGTNESNGKIEIDGGNRADFAAQFSRKRVLVPLKK
jgi:hypothetical protein